MRDCIVGRVLFLIRYKKYVSWSIHAPTHYTRKIKRVKNLRCVNTNQTQKSNCFLIGDVNNHCMTWHDLAWQESRVHTVKLCHTQLRESILKHFLLRTVAQLWRHDTEDIRGKVRPHSIWWLEMECVLEKVSV